MTQPFTLWFSLSTGTGGFRTKYRQQQLSKFLINIYGCGVILRSVGVDFFFCTFLPFFAFLRRTYSCVESGFLKGMLFYNLISFKHFMEVIHNCLISQSNRGNCQLICQMLPITFPIKCSLKCCFVALSVICLTFELVNYMHFYAHLRSFRNTTP